MIRERSLIQPAQVLSGDFFCPPGYVMWCCASVVPTVGDR